MKIHEERSLRDFEFWAGGADNAKELTDEQLDQLELILEDLNPNGVSSTYINDLMWFDFDTIKEWLGIEEYIDGEILNEWWKNLDLCYKECEFDDISSFTQEGEDEEDPTIWAIIQQRWLDAANDWWNNLDEQDKKELYDEYQ